MRKSFVLALAMAFAMALAAVAVAGGGVAHAVATIHGTQGHDWGAQRGNPPGCPKKPCGRLISGTAGVDKIYGHDGWDWIGTKGGSDVVLGGRGMDKAYGKGGADELHGQIGHDHLYGGPRNDKLFLQDGRDEPGHVEQANGTDGRDHCVMDEDPRDAIIVTSCETLVIKDVKDVRGATRLARGEDAWERRDFVSKRFYPGTYRF